MCTGIGRHSWELVRLIIEIQIIKPTKCTWQPYIPILINLGLIRIKCLTWFCFIYISSQLGKYKSTGNLVILGFTTSRTIPIYRRVFVLEYSMTPIGDLELSANSVQNIYPGVHGNPPARFRYPQADVNYDNREFTALVFAPPNWINYDTSNRKSRFEVNTSGLEASCTDKVSTYTMSSTVSAVGSSKR